MDTLLNFWNYQLFVTESQPITLGKIVVALILVFVGFFISRFLSSRLGQKVLIRFKIDRAIRYTIERISFYLLYTAIILTVLQIIGIPLTVFAFVGGALAIGIGFGSQNIVNNFISGLIVMFTQPMRVHDWVEVEGVFGEVESIGSRSTVLKTLDNKQVIMPNSLFLEKAFINWTLTDSAVTASLRVGVAYGTDPHKVREILINVAMNNENVIKDPSPSVLFQDFGDSSLDFDLFFRVEIRRDRTVRRVASDMRFVIDEEFKKHGIEIPFPHRQLYIKPDQKIHVQLETH